MSNPKTKRGMPYQNRQIKGSRTRDHRSGENGQNGRNGNNTKKATAPPSKKK